jgi:hypothetical protein
MYTLGDIGMTIFSHKHLVTLHLVTLHLITYVLLSQLLCFSFFSSCPRSPLISVHYKFTDQNLPQFVIIYLKAKNGLPG